MKLIFSVCLLISLIVTGVQKDFGKTFCRSPVVENGFVLNYKACYEPGEEAKIDCKFGYRSLGRKRLRCMEPGTWAENPPYCEEIKCDKLPRLHYGKIEPDEPVLPGESVNISCEKRFILFGPTRLTCGDDGTWEPYEMMYCQEIQCPQVPHLSNGKVQPQQRVGPGAVQFSCNPGFFLNGPEYLSCQLDGQWVPNVMPFCQEIKCAKLPKLLHGTIYLNNSNIPGSLATFSCDDGYELFGPASVACTSVGKWKPDEMVYCAEIKCDKLPPLHSGKIDPDKPVLPGESVNISCEKGFILLGPTRLKCGDDGTWEQYEMMYCQEIKCTTLPKLSHGTVYLNDSNIPGSLATFSCDQGYELFGPASVTCTTFGKWEPEEMAYCAEVKCATLPKLLHGTIYSNNSNFPGSSATFSCDEGYELFGPANITCTTSGKWEPVEIVYSTNPADVTCKISGKWESSEMVYCSGSDCMEFELVYTIQVTFVLILTVMIITVICCCIVQIRHE